MAETSRQLAQISIDLKKSRIRIHKVALHQIGDPLYIHLLVNTEARQVAIRSVDAKKFDSAAHKVKPSAMDSDFSYEIYSQPFVEKLRKEFDCFHAGTSYRLTGVVIPEERMCVFPLSSIHPIESEVQSNHV